MRFFSRGLRNPLTHFLVIGGSLFLLHGVWQKHFEPPAAFVQKDLVISKNQIEQFKKDVFIQTGSRPSPDQLQRLVQIAIDDEVLYREAIALKLDQNNPSVRRRLIDLAKVSEDSKKTSDDVLYKKALDLDLDRYDPVVRRVLISTMRLIAKKVPTRQAPAQIDPKELEAYFQANETSFMKPAEMKFTHLYFSNDKRAAKALKDAQRVLQKISSQGANAKELPKTLDDKGDAFLGGDHFVWMATSSLERLFGPGFPEMLSHVIPGKWSGPLVSSYGWHLVFIEEIRPARPASLPEVANQIKSAILQDREQKRLSETLQRLRARYQIRIEGEGDPHA